LNDLSNVPGVLDLSKLDVTLALLDRFSDKLGRTGFTLSADNERLLLLASLVDYESGTLGFLLSDLLGLDGGGEFGRECQVLLEKMMSAKPDHRIGI
jgi:hypothetical protein